MTDDKSTEQKEWTPWGISIPAEALYNPDLTFTEQKLLGFIQSLDRTEKGCYASNHYLANLCLVNTQTIINSLKKLREYKYIQVTYKNIKGMTLTKERTIVRNPDYVKIYKPLVITFYKHYNKIPYTELYNLLCDCIKKIMQSHNEMPTNNNRDKDSNKESESYTSYNLSKTPDGDLPNNETSQSLNQSTLIHEGFKAKAKENKATLDKKPLNGPFKKIFDYWAISGLKSPKTVNKTYDKNVVALRSLLKEYSVPDIIKVIDLFKLSLLPDYTPANPKSKEYLRNLYFYEFVRDHKGDSLYNQLLESPPKQLKNAVRTQADPDPNITNFLKNFYMEKILGNAKVELTVADENAFRLATKKLMKFYEDNKGKYPTPWFSFGDIARVYVDAVADFLENKDNSNGRHWGINIFKWDDFFNKYLPAYMHDQAMLINPNNIIGGI